MNNTSTASTLIKNRPTKFNALKIRALTAFENRGWVNVPTWASLVRFNPVRAAYSYLSRLKKLKLLESAKNRSGIIFYRLTQRGYQRLVWLREKKLEEEKQAMKKEPSAGR
jgi:hypothetical protein